MSAGGLPTPAALPPHPTRDLPPPGLRSALLDAGAWLVARVPLRVVDVTAWALAWAWWTVVPIRKRVAVANLRAAIPTAPPRTTLVRMLHDLVLSYAELLQFERLDLRVEGAEDLAGAIILAGHGSAWDVVLCAAGEAYPTSIFLRTPKDRWVQAWLARLRDAHGVGRLETGATMADAYAALAAGRNVLFIQDQRHNAGPALPFFGRPARTSLGAAVAARKTGRPIYGMWQWREGVGRHVIRLRRLDLSGDPEAVTTALNGWYAEQIRSAPSGWLWLHDRWK